MSKKTLQTVLSKKGNYVVGVKGNQKNLHEAVKEISRNSSRASSHVICKEKNRGRQETRKVYVFHERRGISKDWIGIESVIRIERKRMFKGIVENETSYYISSIKAGAKFFNKGIRGHWLIENSLHWVKDVTFFEDKTKLKTGRMPEKISVIVNMVINAFRKYDNKNIKETIRFVCNDVGLMLSLIK